MTLSIIVAMTDERVIGLNNRLPWHISDDLKRFKKITMGHPIIMGRKTFESIGRALPGRENIVITGNPKFQAEGVRIAANLPEALAIRSASQGEVFVIGGARVFEASLPLAQKLYLTLIHHPFKGDVYFPEFDLAKRGRILERSEHQNPPPHSFSYSFIIAELRGGQ